MRMDCGKCGNYLSTSAAPNDVELWVYTDKEWEEKVNIGVIDSIYIPLPTYSVWRCPKCERIYVFEDGNNSAIKIYDLVNNE